MIICTIENPNVCLAKYVPKITFCWFDFMMTFYLGNVFRITGPLWVESIGHWWIALTKDGLLMRSVTGRLISYRTRWAPFGSFHIPYISVVWICIPEDHMVTLLMRAHAKGMSNGDYVFMYYSLPTGFGSFYTQPWLLNIEPASLTLDEIDDRRKAFYPMKQVLTIIYTVQYRYTAVDFLANIHKRHPLARPLGRDMGVLSGSSIWLIFRLSSCDYLCNISSLYCTLSIRRTDSGLVLVHCGTFKGFGLYSV